MEELLNTAPCAFVAFGDNGTVLEVNQTLVDMLGYARVELLGWHVEKLLPPGGRIFYHTHLFPLLKMQGSVEEIYIALRTKDGRDIPVLLNAARRERNGIVVSECICVRMLQRHQFEDQLLQARQLAEEAHAAKTNFLSMMSHDLRTPLTTISGYASLLAMAPLTEEQEEAVESIRNAAGVLMTMLMDILDFAQLDSGRVHLQPRAISVAESISRAEALIRVQFKDAGLTFINECRDPESMVLADPDRLRQILLNLFTNALKFTPAGGSVAVTCIQSEDRVAIHVRDTGIGIAPEHLQTIFSPFVQLDTTSNPILAPTIAAPRGVGLGLAISRNLARSMHGDVTAHSAPGHGSEFTIELPSAPSSPMDESESEVERTNGTFSRQLTAGS